MNEDIVTISWPNKRKTLNPVGSDWLQAASKAGVNIPTGCLSGSCGACEIEVNGEIIRACIAKVGINKSKELRVEFSYDPYW